MPVLSVRNLKKSFFSGKNEIKAVNGLTFSVAESEAFALVGPNGSGKTTTISMIAGMVEPDEGEISVLGKHPGGSGYIDSISVISSSWNFYWHLNAWDLIRFYASIAGTPLDEAFSIAETYGVDEFMHNQTSRISQGQLMRLRLVVGLIKHPKVLIMDEPTVGIDPEISQEFREQMKSMKRKTPILITSHYMKDIEEIADRVCFIINGKPLKIGKLSDFTVSEGEVEIKLTRRIRGLSKLGKLKGMTFITSSDKLFDALSLIGKHFKSIHSRDVDMERFFVEAVKNGKS